MTKKSSVFNKLEAKYKGMSVDVLMEKAHQLKNASLGARKDFILLLYLLERTRRFRQVKGYEKMTFQRFISDQFHLTRGTYDHERLAFLANEKEAVCNLWAWTCD